MKIAMRASCISSVSYIKPQQKSWHSFHCSVVYRPFPTSNHNQGIAVSRISRLYIVRFLHQTTTLNHLLILLIPVVYRPFPTSNHNHAVAKYADEYVVYRPFPTSNHNSWCRLPGRNCRCISSVSYIKPQLP